MKKLLIVLISLMLISTVAVLGQREGDVYQAPEFAALGVGDGACASATQTSQCAEYDLGSDTLPPYVSDTLAAEGVNVGDCGNLIVLSSGRPDDADADLSTDMGTPGCGDNPDGHTTYDCVDLNGYEVPVDSIVVAMSSEWEEWLGSEFTDWMRLQGDTSVDVSINDWTSVTTLGSYGPNEIGTVTLASLNGGETVDLRIADSGDEILDTALMVVPLGCFQEDPETVLCGNGVVEPGEQCDDGNKVSGDGCSKTCKLEDVPPENDIPEFGILGAVAVLGLAGLFVARKRK